MDKIFKTAELLAQHREGYINGILSENPKLTYTDAANTWLILKLAEQELKVKQLEQLIENMESSLTTIKQLILNAKGS